MYMAFTASFSLHFFKDEDEETGSRVYSTLRADNAPPYACEMPWFRPLAFHFILYERQITCLPVSIIIIFPLQRDTISCNEWETLLLRCAEGEMRRTSKLGVWPIIILLVPVFSRTASTSRHTFSSSSCAHPRYHKGPSDPYSSFSLEVALDGKPGYGFGGWGGGCFRCCNLRNSERPIAFMVEGNGERCG